MIQKDLRFPHCYIVVVFVEDIQSPRAGKRTLKYKPVYFNNDDIDRIRKAEIRRTDKLFKVSFQEALRLENVDELVNTVEAVKAAARINLAKMYLFRLESQLDNPEEFFDNYVNLSNEDNEILNKFKEAEI